LIDSRVEFRVVLRETYLGEASMNFVRSKHGIAIGSIIINCPHCGSPPPWLADAFTVMRLLALAGILVGISPHVADLPPGAFSNDWPRKLAGVGLFWAGLCVLIAFYGRRLRNFRIGRRTNEAG